MSLLNTVVIGGSAGSIEALQKIVGGLPPDLPAALLAVVHLAPRSNSYLPSILNRVHTLPAVHPRDGQRIEPGRIYVAPPDRHMLIDGDNIALSHGPEENLARPSIDVLFRSAASLGVRATAILLSGALDDGVLGLTELSEAGGTTLVQSPDDALFPYLPQAGLDMDHVDVVLPADQIASWLIHNMHRSGQPRVQPAKPNELHADGKQESSARDLGCPACGGVLSMTNRKLDRYRCEVGHTYGTTSLLDDQSAMIERALWSAVRALEERKVLLHRVTTRTSARLLVEKLHKEIELITHQCQMLRQLIATGWSPQSEPDLCEAADSEVRLQKEEAG